MPVDELRQLAEQLGADPPAALDRLSPGDLRDLSQAIRAARHRQAAELQAAGDQAFRHVPRLLRAPIRAIMR